MSGEFSARLQELRGKPAYCVSGGIAQALLNLLPPGEGRVVLLEGGRLKAAGVAEELKNRLGDRLLVLPDQVPVTHQRSGFRGRIGECEVGILPVDYLLEDTATAVLLTASQISRLAALLPPVLILVAAPDVLLTGLAQLFERLDPAEDTPFFFTGPSRTADIEKTLVLGVHGPGELTILMVQDDEQKINNVYAATQPGRRPGR